MSAICNFSLPERQKELRRFLGMVNFYHRFLPRCANYLTQLNHVLSCSVLSNKKNSQNSNLPLKWTDEAKTAFQTAKDALVGATLLVHPVHNAPINIMVDASDLAVGCMLQQYQCNMWKPLGFFSKKLRPPETKYSAFDRELLAVYLSVKHFHHFVEGREFHVLTDHKPLTFCLTSKTERPSPRQIRHLVFIAEFTTDIRHVAGSDNPTADALSRLVGLR